MKKAMIKVIAVAAFLIISAPLLYAGEMQVLVDKLVEKGILTAYEGQILMSQAKEEAAKEMIETKKMIVPSWTDKVKIKGDVRFRTQEEWGKGFGPAHQRIRQRVRARLGVEGKVNDQIKAGILAVTGSADPRSTNQTLDNLDSYDFRLDQYYINWTPALPKEIGKGDLYLGKFKNPISMSSILWDGDINPGGMGVKYSSPKFELGEIPFSLYANGGMFWVREISTSQRDPLLWSIQGGFKADVVKDWGATADLSVAYHDFAHAGTNQDWGRDARSATTNTVWGGRYGNTYRYDFNLVDILFKYDSKQIGNFHLGHGLFGDFIWNADAPKNNFAWHLGGYIGDKKVNDTGKWKLKGEYRSIMRDAVPDFLPDSDFMGFTTQGRPSGGGTGGEGFVGSFKYGLMKNLVAGISYYYSQPISINKGLTNSYDEPYNIVMFDIETKF
jgi:polyhydroxyalkanoate synthesis regulator phasin